MLRPCRAALAAPPALGGGSSGARAPSFCSALPVQNKKNASSFSILRANSKDGTGGMVMVDASQILQHLSQAQQFVLRLQGAQCPANIVFQMLQRIDEAIRS
eukprot:1366735-Karenia_brevis.AAC.1